MSNDVKIILTMVDEPNGYTKSGEHLLWFNVLDRALQDYTRFFDWYVQRAVRSNNGKTADVTRESLRGLMAYELDVLKWFFFSTQSTPFNLTWIFDHCFGGDERLLAGIRERVREKHLTNLVENKKHPAVKHLYKSYSNDGLLKDIITDTPPRKIRWHVSSLH